MIINEDDFLAEEMFIAKQIMTITTMCRVVGAHWHELAATNDDDFDDYDLDDYDLDDYDLDDYDDKDYDNEDNTQGCGSPLARISCNWLHRTHPSPHHFLHWSTQRG